MGSAVPSCVSPLILHTQAESDWLMVLTHAIPPAFRDGVYSSLPSTEIRHRASPELIGSCNCAPMAFTAESPPAQGQLSFIMDQSINNARLFFPTPTNSVRMYSLVDMFDTCKKVSEAVCMCVFSSHPFWTSSSLDVPAGVTQEEGHTGFLIHLPSAVRALIFVARRIQPFLSLVDREVEFCVLTN